MKQAGWTLQSRSISETAPGDALLPGNAMAPSEKGKDPPVKSETETVSAQATSAEEVNSRINRILRIVQSPSAGKDDDVQKRRGKERKGDRKTGGGGGGISGNSATIGGNGRQRGRRGGKNSGGNDSTDQGSRANWSKNENGRGKYVDEEPVPNSNASSDGGGDFDANAEVLDNNRQKLNKDAPIFVPSVGDSANVDVGAHPMCWTPGYYDDQGQWHEGDMFPEVTLGSREGEFIGLQCIAEMGEWVVLRENKPLCLPFFWSRDTGFKTWEVPPSIKETGIADMLKKWSVELPETGVAPGPEAVVWPEPLWARRPRPQQEPETWNTPAPKAAPPGFTDISDESARKNSAPPGFGDRPVPSGDKGAGKRRKERVWKPVETT
mmetsp:Transcript_116936/g.183918  ORF Transcript_116936/g.183918 Transcript_116936/m.183918 type:complete len:380 (-) Transcript_116936:211-1350(-)